MVIGDNVCTAYLGDYAISCTTGCVHIRHCQAAKQGRMHQEEQLALGNLSVHWNGTNVSVLKLSSDTYC